MEFGIILMRMMEERTKKEKSCLISVGAPIQRHLYLVREDERLLRDFWVINSLDDSPSLTTYRYEFPGDKNVTQNELVIVDVIGRTVKNRHK